MFCSTVSPTDLTRKKSNFTTDSLFFFVLISYMSSKDPPLIITLSQVGRKGGVETFIVAAPLLSSTHFLLAILSTLILSKMHIYTHTKGLHT